MGPSQALLEMPSAARGSRLDHEYERDGTQFPLTLSGKPPTRSISPTKHLTTCTLPVTYHLNDDAHCDFTLIEDTFFAYFGFSLLVGEHKRIRTSQVPSSRFLTQGRNLIVFLYQHKLES
ncbi:hypothetical protein RB195_009594 [Necator americanus]|uniref:Uncharacterized protein n=1 Tax=Necator americanus TaxID=51031 RepID=A0ABR1CU08_NECAM